MKKEKLNWKKYWFCGSFVIIALLFSALVFNGLSNNNINPYDDFSNTASTNYISDKVESVYVYNNNVSVGDTEYIAVSFKDGVNPKSAELNLHRNDDSKNFSQKAEIIDNFALFSLNFVSNDDLGEYCVDSVNWKDNLTYNQSLDMKNDNGYTFVVEPTINNLGEDVPAEIYSIEDDGSLTQFGNLSEAMTSEKSKMMFSKDAVNLHKEANGEIVVCLDPGHGGSESGKIYDGNLEKDINLKIALACRDELSQYDGVRVVMTRDNDATVGLHDRVPIAQSYGANLFVSLHNNSGGGHGSEVWVQHPDGSFHPDFYGIGNDIGNRLLEKLNQTFGLYNRGVKTKKMSDETYPDGSPADWYAVLRDARRVGIPSMIVEHAFMDGGGIDATVLYNDTNLHTLGVLDAQAIAEHYGLSKEPAAIVNETFQLCSAIDNNYVIDVANGSLDDGAELILNKSNTSSLSQTWRVSTNTNSGKAIIMNAASNKAIDLPFSRVEDGNVINQYELNETSAQNWKLVDEGDGLYKIETSLNNNYVLDVAYSRMETGTKIQLYASNDTNAQRFYFKKLDSPDTLANIEDGEYAIGTYINPSKVLDIEGSSRLDGGKVQVYDYNGTNAQRFNIKTDKNTGLSTIQNVNSNKMLNVPFSSQNAWTDIWQYSDDGSDACKWYIIKDGDAFRLKPKVNSNLCLNLRLSSAVNGNTFMNYYFTSSDANKFCLSKTDPHVEPGLDIIEEGDYSLCSSINNNVAISVPQGQESTNHALLKSDKYYDSYYVNEIFSIKRDADNFYRIVNKRNMALDVVNGSIISGTSVQICPSDINNNNQKWAAHKDDNGNYYFINKASGTVLDILGGKAVENMAIVSNTYNNIGTQKWKLLKKEKPKYEIINGTYIIASSINNNKVVDLAYSSLQDGSNISLYSFNDTNAQKWIIQTDPVTGYATIKSAASGKVMDVAYSSTAPGTNIWQYQQNGTNAQKWRFYKDGDNYRIISALSDDCVLDVAGSCMEDFTNIQIYSCNYTAAQSWALRETSVTDDHSIIYTPRVNAKQMTQYYRAHSPIQYPDYASIDGELTTIESFCNVCYDEAVYEGVEPGVLFCQAMLETGFLNFGGLVDIRQFNFGGMGATGHGHPGDSYSTMTLGLRAQVQHLERYATTRSLPIRGEITDKRWNYIAEPGCAPRLEDLNGRWAVPGTDYGQTIWRMLTEVASYPA